MFTGSRIANLRRVSEPRAQISWMSAFVALAALGSRLRLVSLVTRAAAIELGWSKKRTQALVDGVRASVWKEVAWEASLFPPRQWFRVAPNAAYHPAHHFDRALESTHALAFQNGVRFARATADSVSALAHRGEWEQAVAAMGAGVHAVQDLASHSNFIDLVPPARRDRSVMPTLLFVAAARRERSAGPEGPASRPTNSCNYRKIDLI